ncbi:MAG: stalk domain-containing protein [bacterium]
MVTPEGILLVPLRAVVEAAGGRVEWQAETRTVTRHRGRPDGPLHHRQPAGTVSPGSRGRAPWKWPGPR